MVTLAIRTVYGLNAEAMATGEHDTLNMRILLPLPIALLLEGCFSGQVDDHGGRRRSTNVKAERKLTGEFAASTRSLRVENQFGEVVIASVPEGFGWDWEAKRWAETSEAAQEAVNAVRLEVSERGGRYEVILVLAESWQSRGMRFQSDLRLRVPAEASVEVRNTFGATEVSGAQGPGQARCEFSQLRLKSIKGTVTAATWFARQEAEQVGPSRLQNRHGAVQATHVSGDVVAKTSFAPLHVEDVQGAAELTNQNGEITTAAGSASVNAKTSFARMELDGQGTTFSAHNQHGLIRPRNLRKWGGSMPRPRSHRSRCVCRRMLSRWFERQPVSAKSNQTSPW